MSKRKTVGERIAENFWDTSWCEMGLGEFAKLIDRAIRRAQAKAWEGGRDAGSYAVREGAFVENPYRGRVGR